MKKIHIIAALLAMLLPTMVFASSTWYAQLDVNAVSSPTGTGKVYISKDSDPSSTSTYNELPASSSKQTENGGKDDKSHTFTFHISATANYGSKFDGWYTDSAGNTLHSRDVTSTYKITCTEQKTLTTGTIYAKFITNPDSYGLVLNKPDGLESYNVTGPNGFDGSGLSQGGSTTVYKGDTYKISCTIADKYDFVSWKVNANIVEDRVLTVTISGETQIELNLKEKVEVTATCKGEIGGTYKANGELVSGSDHSIRQFGSVSVNLSEATPATGYEFYGWYKLRPNGAKEYLSYYKTASAEKNENITVGAEFRPIPNPRITLEAPAAGSFTCQAGNGNPVSVDSENPYIDVEGRLTSTFAVTAAPDNTRPKWYIKGELGDKTFFAVGSPATKVFTEDATVGVVFEPVNTGLASAIADAQAGDGTAVLSADAEVLCGTTITIPDNVTINLDGHTLYVDGTLTVNGLITGGTVSKCTKLVKQTGDDLKPFNPYESLKYWKTTVSSGDAVLNNASNSKSHLSIYNAFGECADRKDITDSTPVAVQCSANPSQNGVNLPGKILKIYTSAPDLESLATDNSTTYNDIMNSSSKMVFALQNLTISYVEDGTKNRNKKAGVVDCAGYEFKTSRSSGSSSNYEVKSGTLFALINAKKGTVPQLTGSLAMFINCQSVSATFHTSASNADALYLYDCTISSGIPTAEKTSSTVEWPVTGVHIYSGKYSFTSIGQYWKIYGGSYTKKPADGNIGLNGYKFYQHMDDLWYLEPSQDFNVAKVGAKKFEDFESAFNRAIELGSAKIELLRNATVDKRLVLPAKKSVEIELDGSILTSTAGDGLFLNNGSLTIGDGLGRLSNSGLTASNGYLIENNNGGTVKIAYGVYNGIIKLNEGSKFTTHHGLFNGGLATDVADPSGVADIRGGKFDSDVSSFLKDGYEQREGYVGFFPWVLWKDGEVSGYTSYNFSALDPTDMELFKSSEATKESYYANNSYDKWYRRAELKSALAPHLTHTIDFVLKFDRSVESGSVNAVVKMPHKFPSIDKEMPLDTTVLANNIYRAMSPLVKSYGYYQIAYNELVTDGAYKEVICGIKDNNGDNKGTTCSMQLDLCTGSKKTDLSKLTSLYSIFSKSLVFDAGSNKAMLQTAAGAVPDENFFATLAAAVESDKTTDKTIKLCNDCEEAVTVSKACTIDTNGFEFSGTLTAGEGLSKTEANGVYVFSAPNPTDVYVEQVKVDNVVSQVVSEEWLVANEIDTTNASPADIQAAVQDVLNEKDDNGNAKWENLVIGQKADEKAAVTAANGGNATTANIEVSFEVPTNAETGEKIDTGYTVKYAFDKTDSTGTVEGEAQDNPTIDLKGVKENDPTYFTMRAVLEATDDSGVTAEVPVEKTIGVLKVASDTEITFLPVPWQSLGDTDIKAIKVSELVHAASLSDDDELIVYGADGKPQTWVVKDGEWTAPIAEYTIGGGDSEPQQEEAQVAAELKRGQGVILKRTDTTKEIVLIGQAVASEETVETPIAVATSSTEPSWNLVASPKMVEVAVDTVAGANTSDEIIVPTAGTPKHYTYKNNAWGYTGKIGETEVTLPGGVKTKAVQFGRKTNDTTVPAGQGFWYLNKDSSNNEKKIKW